MLLNIPRTQDSPPQQRNVDNAEQEKPCLGACHQPYPELKVGTGESRSYHWFSRKQALSWVCSWLQGGLSKVSVLPQSRERVTM